MKENTSSVNILEQAETFIRENSIQKLKGLFDGNPDFDINTYLSSKSLGTLINSAPRNNRSNDRTEIIKLLIDKGADVNITSSESSDTPLIVAININSFEIVKSLYNAGADINKNMPLIMAICNSSAEIAEFLIEKGADVNVIDEDGTTALYYAVGSYKPQMIKVIRALVDKGVDLFYGKPDMNPLEHAVTINNIDAFKILLEIKTDFDFTAFLHTLVKNKGQNPKFAELLIDAKADLLDKKTLFNIIQSALKNNPTNIMQFALEDDQTNVIESLVDIGIDISQQDKGAISDILHESISARCFKLSKALIEAGADVNIINCGNSPLHIAIARNNINIVKLLLEHGANIDITDKVGVTPLSFAVMRAQCDMVKLFIQSKADSNKIDDTGYSALHWATKATEDSDLGNNFDSEIITIIELLLETNIKVNILSNDGKRAIDLVDRSKLEFGKIIKLLRDYGSVEPKEPIKSTDIEQKLILESGTAPDGDSNNKIAATDLLEAMIKKYPLTDEQIDQAIVEFKNDNIEQNKNNSILNPLFKDMRAAWGAESVGNDGQLIRINNVEEVLKRLSEMTDVEDRLPVHWNFKQILGTIIHIIGDDVTLQNNLTDTLREIQMCNLSKLMHLIYVVQDQIIEDQNVIDYSKANLEDFKEVSDASANIISSSNEKAPFDFIKWLSDRTNKITPEDWSLSTQKIQGIFNKIFSEIFSKINIDSYHYIDGLNKIFIENFVTLIKAEKADEPLLKSWLNIIAKGEEFFISNYFDEILKGNIELESLENASFSQEMNFGNFSNLSIQTIQKYIDLFGDQGAKFLELIKENCALSDEVEDHIKHVLNNIDKFDNTDVSNQKIDSYDLDNALTLNNNEGDVHLGGEENTVEPGMYQID